MLTVEEARAKFGVNLLDEANHAIGRIVDACARTRNKKRETLARMANADIIQTVVYQKICAHLEGQQERGRPVSLQDIRKECFSILVAELTLRGFRTTLVAVAPRSRTA